jgi:hypothetical protein
LDFSSYRQRIKDYDRVVDELLADFPQIKVYDPTSLLCRNGQCFAADDRLPYYENGDHLNYHGAEMVIKDMLNLGLGRLNSD